jgi:hypothetical protein
MTKASEKIGRKLARKYGPGWYKVTTSTGQSIFFHSYSLPEGRRPGEWQTVKGRLKLCQWGFHASKFPYDWVNWVSGWRQAPPRIFLCQLKGIAAHTRYKSVARSIRLVREIKRDGREWNRLKKRERYLG